MALPSRFIEPLRAKAVANKNTVAEGVSDDHYSPCEVIADAVRFDVHLVPVRLHPGRITLRRSLRDRTTLWMEKALGKAISLSYVPFRVFPGRIHVGAPKRNQGV